MSKRVKMILFLVVTLLAVGYDIRLSLDPHNYFRYETQEIATWKFPAGMVAVVSLIMLCEATVVAFALFGVRPATRWARGLIALSLLIPWGMLTGMLTMHAPGYFLFHHLWLWLWILILSATTLTFAVSGAIGRFRRSRSAT